MWEYGIKKSMNVYINHRIRCILSEEYYKTSIAKLLAKTRYEGHSAGTYRSQCFS